MYRQTFTQKWMDKWFGELSKDAKLIFLYLLDNCDSAGFYEINFRSICFCTGTTKIEADAALIELNKAVHYLNKDKTHIWLKNFLNHPKKIPFNVNNNEHLGIIKIILKMIERFDANYTKPLNDILPQHMKKQKEKQPRQVTKKPELTEDEAMMKDIFIAKFSEFNLKNSGKELKYIWSKNSNMYLKNIKQLIHTHIEDAKSYPDGFREVDFFPIFLEKMPNWWKINNFNIKTISHSENFIKILTQISNENGKLNQAQQSGNRSNSSKPTIQDFFTAAAN
jgi:hypothetical protein